MPVREVVADQFAAVPADGAPVVDGRDTDHAPTAATTERQVVAVHRHGASSETAAGLPSRSPCLSVTA